MAAEKITARDYLFWTIGLLLAAAGIFAYYYFAGQIITPLRVGGMLAAIGAGAWVFAQTTRGRDFFVFLREADIERRKVVWPTRNETMQTTIVVIVLVLLCALVLFLADTVFGWLVRQLIGTGGA